MINPKQSKEDISNERDIPKVSNIATDEILALRFHKSAYYAVKLFKMKYYTVFASMTEDDIVQEVWLKVIKNGICYDETRNPNFDAFVRMIVNSKIMDCSRILSRRLQPVSLEYTLEVTGDSELPVDDIYNVQTPLGSTEVAERDIVQREISKSFKNCVIEDCSVDDILDMREQGYTNVEISDKTGLTPTKLSNALRGLKSIYLNRLNGTGYSLEDILFNDELNYFSTHDKKDFFNSTSYIRDAESGIRLSDILRYVLAGKSYRYIAEKLKVSPKLIQNFLESQMCQTF